MKLQFRSMHKHRKTIYITSILSSILGALIISVVNYVFAVNLPIPPQTLIILTIVFFSFFPGLVDFAYGRWRRQVDGAVPRMLSDVTSGVKTGLSLTRALETASERDYGPLTAELKTFAAQLSWGVTFEDAMSSMLKRIDTLLTRRTFQLLLEADRAGGRIEDLLDAIQRHTIDLQDIEKERKATLRPYIVITYIAFGVFLAIAVLLINSFFSSVLSTQSKIGSSGANIFAGLGGLDLPTIKQTFFQMALIQAIFGGLGAGKLGEASFAAGFKHIIILVVITLVVFATILS